MDTQDDSSLSGQVLCVMVRLNPRPIQMKMKAEDRRLQDNSFPANVQEDEAGNSS